jgi:ankyrin repeat protein
MSAPLVPSQETIDQFVGNAHGNLAVVKELLTQYPSIISANASWTETAVQAAAQTGQVEIVNYLIDHGADYDICTAAMLGHLDCMDDFLAEDPDRIHARGAHGIPLLYFPVIHAHIEVANYLLQRGADPNAASPDGITPLHAAVMFNQPGMARWLLEHGANPGSKYEGKTPLAIALEKNQDNLAEVLRAHGAQV